MSQSGPRILDPVFKGGGVASPKGKWISKFWCQSGVIFEWSGSEVYELSCWILLVEQSAQISYMIFRTFTLSVFNFFGNILDSFKLQQFWTRNMKAMVKNKKVNIAVT